MVTVGHAHEGGGRLALGAGGDNGYLLRRQAAHPLQGNQDILRSPQVLLLKGHLDVVHHAAAGDEHVPAVGVGGVEHLLDAGDEGSEGGDDDAPGGVRHDLLQGVAHHVFG